MKLFKPASYASHHKTGLAVLLLALVLLQFFWPMLFQGKVPFDRDFSLVTYPVKFTLHQAYHEGYLPFWDDSVHAGTPFLAELHPGVFYPPSLFFFLDDFITALNLFYVFHFVLLAAGTYLLMRCWKVSRTGALASAFTATLGGFIFSSASLSNFFLGSAWLPAVFWVLENHKATGRSLWFVLTVVLIACQTLAACPEVNIMTCGLLWLSMVFASDSRRRPDRAGPIRWAQPAGALLAAVVLALALIAAQLLPTYHLMQHSSRTGGGSYTFHTQWSLDGETFRTFLLPRAMNGFETATLPGEQSGFLESIYMGVFPILLGVLAFRFWRDRRIRFWLIMFLLGLFLAFGKYNPLYQYVYNWVPFLDRFRYPEKYMFVTAFAAVFLVGLVWDRMLHASRERTLSEKTVMGAVLAVAAVIGVTALGAEAADPGPSLLILLAFGLAYLFFYFHRVQKHWLQLFFVVALVVDLTARNFALLPLIDRSYYETAPVMAESVQPGSPPYRLYSGRIETEPDRFQLPNAPTRLAALYAMKEYMYPFLGTVYGVEYADGLPGLAMGLKDHMLWYRALHHARVDTRFRILKRSNVKYWIDLDRPTAYINNSPLILPDRLKTFDDALPRAFWVPQARQVPPVRLLGLYYAEGFDPRDEVLLAVPPPLPATENASGQVVSIDYAPNRVTVTTRQFGNGYLVLLDSWMPGWQVRIDGEPGAVLRGNHFYRAVPLGPGVHTLEFEYIPEGWRTGRLVSGGAFIVLLLVTLLPARLRRRARR